jgi:hypothetical protein
MGEDKVTGGVAVFVGTGNVECAESDDTENGRFSNAGRRQSSNSLKHITIQGAVWRTRWTMIPLICSTL